MMTYRHLQIAQTDIEVLPRISQDEPVQPEAAVGSRFHLMPFMSGREQGGAR